MAQCGELVAVVEGEEKLEVRGKRLAGTKELADEVGSFSFCVLADQTGWRV